MSSRSLVPRTRAWDVSRRNTLERDRGLCRVQIPGICTGKATEVDHITPLADGGDPYDMGNLRASCRACNARLGGQTGSMRKAKKRKWSREW